MVSSMRPVADIGTTNSIEHHVTPNQPWRDPVLDAKLQCNLGPEYMSTRTGAGNSKVSYLEGWQAVQLANELFGHNGWSSEIREHAIDFVTRVKLDHFNPETQRWSVSGYCLLRITLRDGSYREDIGCGSAENVKSKQDGLSKVRKEAVTDAQKRVLKNFGQALGNCWYDPEHRARVTPLQVRKAPFNPRTLYRSDDVILSYENAANSSATPAVEAKPNGFSKAPQARPVPALAQPKGAAAPASKPVPAAPVRSKTIACPVNNAARQNMPLQEEAAAVPAPQIAPGETMGNLKMITSEDDPFDSDMFDSEETLAYARAVEGDSGFGGDVMPQMNGNKPVGEGACEPPAPPKGQLPELEQKRQEMEQKRQDAIRRKNLFQQQQQQQQNGEAMETVQTAIQPPQRAYTTGSANVQVRPTPARAMQQRATSNTRPVIPPPENGGFMSGRTFKRTIEGPNAGNVESKAVDPSVAAQEQAKRLKPSA
ncbi:DNA repair protein rad52 [Microbotryomycetes sp. JL221]|nr:DNA repair protein rad52 [Microbotryomycetes sp. JL221]